VDCVQLAAAVGPASLLAGGNVLSLSHVPVHAAASCDHHSGSLLPSLKAVEEVKRLPLVGRSNSSSYVLGLRRSLARILENQKSSQMSQIFGVPRSLGLIDD
jgi:hypothetical protein